MAIWGFDAHAESIEEARRNAEQAGVAERVTFQVAHATGYPVEAYDLICYFDCLHDMGHRDRALRYAEKALAVDGTVMLVEPFARDRVEDNANPVGQLYYSASTALCCPPCGLGIGGLRARRASRGGAPHEPGDGERLQPGSAGDEHPVQPGPRPPPLTTRAEDSYALTGI